MIRLHSPKDEVELAFLKSILEGEKIRYFVRGDNFGSWRVGPPIEFYNKKDIMLDESDFQRAQELLSDYLAKVKGKKEKSGEKKVERKSYANIIRMFLEFLFFGWFVPGKRCRKREDKNGQDVL